MMRLVATIAVLLRTEGIKEDILSETFLILSAVINCKPVEAFIFSEITLRPVIILSWLFTMSLTFGEINATLM